MLARHQRLAERRCTIAFGIGTVESDEGQRREAEGEFRREAVAVAAEVATVERVAVVAHGRDGLEPGRVVRLPLHEGAADGAIAVRREQITRARGIGDRDGVPEGVAAIGHRVMEWTGVEARGVVDVEAGGVDSERTCRERRPLAALFVPWTFVKSVMVEVQ